MQRIFNKLYQLSVLHTFYTNEESEDFSIVPIGTTGKVLRGLGMVCRTDTKGFELIYRAENEDGDPAVTIDEDHVVAFGIELKNERAHYFTEFPEKDNNSDIYYCNGAYDDSSLSLSAQAIRQPSFTEEYTYAFERVTFKVLDADGNKYFESTQTGTENDSDPTLYDFSFSVNFGTNFKMGMFTLQTFNNGILQDEDEVYIFDRFTYPNLIGIFELELNSAIDYTTVPYTATLDLSPSSATWTYEVEFTRDFTNAILSITNADGGSTVDFGLPTAATDYSSGDTISFESSEAIPKSELPNTNFSLEVTSDDIDLTLTGLPNPPHHNSNSIVYLKI